MIHPHTSLKFQVVITIDGFDQNADPWKVIIRDQFSRIYATITPEDCARDDQGNWYIFLSDVPLGKYFATTVAYVPDEDYDDGYMIITDRQHLVDVGFCECHNHKECCCQTDGMTVVFTRVFTTNIDNTAYLCDKDGNLILTADGKRIKFITPTPNTEES